MLDVFSALADSRFAPEHRNRLLDGYAASTVFRYMQAVQQFSKTINKLGWDFATLTQSQLVDTLSVMSQSRSCSSDGMSGNFTIKALRWFRKIAGVRCLDLAFSPLVDSFLKMRLTKDKREASPLPLWILFQWERRLLQSQCTTFEIIMLGSFLFVVWSGLRFADAQRLNLQSLVLNDEELRGMVWRSKTHSNGHPFGVVSSGICSTGTYTWLVKFLRTWDKLLEHSELKHCDFLIPHISEHGSLLSGDPMDYASTQKILRYMLRTPWKTFKDAHPLDSLTMNYTVHSLKATLLSFGPQLGNADPRKSLHLYGRDSVWGSLRYQTTVIQQIRSGFRPKTAQHRGGQFPLVEPPVALELFKKTASDFAYQCLPFAVPAPILEEPESHPVEVDSDSSSSSSSSSSESRAPSVKKTKEAKSQPPPVDCQSDEAILAKYRKVTHAMVLDKTGARDLPCFQDRSWRPACGARMVAADTIFLDEWSPDLSFCQHPGCKKAWAAIGMF